MKYYYAFDSEGLLIGYARTSEGNHIFAGAKDVIERAEDLPTSAQKLSADGTQVFHVEWVDTGQVDGNGDPIMERQIDDSKDPITLT